jgi:hypothetical protein
MTRRFEKASLVRLLAILWIFLTLALAARALLKPTTTSSDLGYVPFFFVEWLDRNYNVRTLVMTLLITSVPTVLLAISNPLHAKMRRGLLIVAASALLAMEFAQIWIPTRGFGWEDVGYTLLGTAISEALASVCAVAFTYIGRNAG